MTPVVLTVAVLASAGAFIVWGPRMDARNKRRFGDVPKPVLLRWPVTTRASGVLIIGLWAFALLTYALATRR